MLHAHLRLGWGPRKGDTDIRYIETQFSGVPLEKAKEKLAESVCRSLGQKFSTPKQANINLKKSFKIHSYSNAQKVSERHKVRKDAEKNGTLDIHALYKENINRYNTARLVEIAMEQEGIAFSSRLNEFWTNHFNVNTSTEGKPAYFSDYVDTIGKFQQSTFLELLMAVGEHPLMQMYLDNIMNAAPEFNLNYARELLELHTLGAQPKENIYTQNDIEEVAKVLSGYRFNGLVALEFDLQRHASGEKNIFGKKISVGHKGVEELFELLANHPQTKKNICKKLYVRFVGEAHPKMENLKDCINSWGHGGNLMAMYQSMVTSSDFWKKDNFQKSLKDPIFLVISLNRLHPQRINEKKSEKIRNYLKRSSQLYAQVPQPTGYDDNFETWILPIHHLISWKNFKDEYLGDQRKDLYKSSSLQIDHLDFMRR